MNDYPVLMIRQRDVIESCDFKSRDSMRCESIIAITLPILLILVS